MGCYTVPLTAAIIHFFARKKPTLKSNKYHLWLNQLFLGGALFGVVDHIWNGDLLKFSLSDLLLGFVITLVTVLVWTGMVVVDTHKLKSKASA
jgi:FtsH-binding integral membrane protein